LIAFSSIWVHMYSQICPISHLPLTANCLVQPVCFWPSPAHSQMKQSVLNGHLLYTVTDKPVHVCVVIFRVCAGHHWSIPHHLIFCSGRIFSESVSQLQMTKKLQTFSLTYFVPALSAASCSADIMSGTQS
jgi:hypothetical protein